MSTRMEARVEMIEKGLESLRTEFDQWHPRLEKIDKLDDKLDSFTTMLHTMMKDKGPEQGFPSAATSHGVHTISDESPGSGAHSTPRETANKMTLPPFTSEEPKAWLSRAKQYFQLNLILEHCKVEVALVAMEGAALHWLCEEIRLRICSKDVRDLFDTIYLAREVERELDFSRGHQMTVRSPAKSVQAGGGSLVHQQSWTSGVGHATHSSDKTLQVIIIAQSDEEDVPENPEALQHELVGPKVVEEQLCTVELSQVTAGGFDSPQTMKLQGKINETIVVVMVDSGAITCYVFLLDSVDVILGVSWLSTLGEVQANWGTMSMKFMLEGRVVTLRGEPSLMCKQVSVERLSKINEVEAFKNSTVLNSISMSQCISEDRSTQFGGLHALAVEFPIVLSMLPGLPLHRAVDHRIPLQPGATPVSGVHMDPGKIFAIMRWTVPKSIKGVRGFLGLTCYYRWFIRDYGQLARPLIELLRKQQVGHWAWTAAAQEAFEQLQKVITSAPVLVMPDFSLPFVIECDASAWGLVIRPIKRLKQRLK
ncbi:ATP binding / aminoacyl-tRNA ligase/ nucleotide binding protein [Perilla frutescens var. hirtella]|uniref:ATP binding / aminoacyl-tRNA ligase/ nucleotide binding protein n=1 Tax=Perilla frutescens var. hirtella TaxID=608512 RepID=A0AAD4IZ64_PERFH|nr:ATP binding / aminoacyl-tRNA ligase/ nucleotide binding protein [Perilla frutescens var. hirtella]